MREKSCSVREEPQDRANGGAPGGDARGAGLRPPDLRLNASKTESGLELATISRLMCGALGRRPNPPPETSPPSSHRAGRRGAAPALRARAAAGFVPMQREKPRPQSPGWERAAPGSATGQTQRPLPRSPAQTLSRLSAPHGKPPAHDLRKKSGCRKR